MKFDTLYFQDHFNKRFQEKVDKFGVGRMALETRRLKSYTDNAIKLCNEPISREKRHTLITFELRKNLAEPVLSFCRRIIYPEMDYSRDLFRRQYPDWNKMQEWDERDQK